MRKYLVTGGSGWLAGELTCRLDAFPGHYELTKVSVRGSDWQEADWSVYDGVFHFAAAVYGDDPESVNADLTKRVADKCVTDRVPWMLLMSSFSVYGADADPDILVDIRTELRPATPYGKSKLASEEVAQAVISGSNTALAVVRAPLIYGPGQRKGSFPALMKLSGKIPLFPQTKNTRSMIFSQNLCELCRLLADEHRAGLFLPQDEKYFDTAELVRALALRQNHRVMIVPGCSRFTHFASRFISKLGKLFGNARYAYEASECGYAYQIFNIKTALDTTVQGEAQ